MKGAPFLALSLREVGPGQRIQSMIRLRPVPRRLGPQHRVIARQLSGLSVSRTQFAALVGKLRALDLGSVWREADGGPRKGALTRGDLGFSHLKHSFPGGLTLRARGFP